MLILMTADYLNDLWSFNVSSGNWTWVGGQSTLHQVGIYTGSTAWPGSRYNAEMWVTPGYIYVFGGVGLGNDTASGINQMNGYDFFYSYF